MKGLFLILYIIDLQELLMDTSDVPSVMHAQIHRLKKLRARFHPGS
jgi:hypothetical protein